jgi:hypothetical protein
LRGGGCRWRDGGRGRVVIERVRKSSQQ